MSPRETDRPVAGWRQLIRDLCYLLPGMPLAIVSFVVMIAGLALGIGLFLLAFLGLVILALTLLAARRFAMAERARVGVLEGRAVGPVYYRPTTGRALARLLGHLRDPQSWRDWLHGVVILPVRVLTWSLTMACVGICVGLTPLILISWLVSGGGGFRGLPRGLALMLRGLATVEASVAWALLTNEGAAWRARAEELGRSRQAVVQAEADTLRRVERDIHDGPQQRLVRLTMDLQSAQRRLNDDPQAAGPLVDGALKQTQEALAELRALSRGIAPPILTDRGLRAALAAAAARNPIPTTVDVHLGGDERLPASVENAAYFVVTESLANAAKHSDATRCDVSVIAGTTGDAEGRAVSVLHVQVSDDGRGGAHIGKGHGLAGLTDRLAGVDGILDVHSPPAGGTTVTATIPLSR
ncbi:sensor histidine kinase [Phytoactinopolyspora alkaliphila]|uniref:histidine kinase n=2 Tax=Phytoactinopolyspora alkaliphila TaxID=1783498 RepID=A0A6N9YR05_9ACTN|nr:sensor histidine kinase [Phytoactinopolyspora alkaliphila]NED97360.1 sensor histidine kinase [Phytoactinopolyspora alkaliphila]